VVFREQGALQVVECWGDDVPDGKLTSFPMAVRKEPDETVVFAWITWPSRAARDERMRKVMADPRLQPEANPMPFDGKRMTYGGFEMLLDAWLLASIAGTAGLAAPHKRRRPSRRSAGVTPAAIGTREGRAGAVGADRPQHGAAGGVGASAVAVDQEAAGPAGAGADQRAHAGIAGERADRGSAERTDARTRRRGALRARHVRTGAERQRDGQDEREFPHDPVPPVQRWRPRGAGAGSGGHG
jgi:uncharacterized protein YbaA (DUF1428 family)